MNKRRRYQAKRRRATNAAAMRLFMIFRQLSCELEALVARASATPET